MRCCLTNLAAGAVGGDGRVGRGGKEVFDARGWGRRGSAVGRCIGKGNSRRNKSTRDKANVGRGRARVIKVLKGVVLGVEATGGGRGRKGGADRGSRSGGKNISVSKFLRIKFFKLRFVIFALF